MYLQYYASPIGKITMASNGTELIGLWMEGQKNFAATLPKDCEVRSLPVFDQTAHWLDEYFAGKCPGFMPPILMEGTAFRKEVWEILKTIPYGCTMTYGEIAAILAKRKGLKKMSAQAVGGAVGHNPISILIPCHRVIGAGGALTGYSGGVHLKEWLLALESKQGSENNFQANQN